MLTNRAITFTIIVLGAVLLGGCSTAPKTLAKRSALHKEVISTIERFKAHDSSMSALFQSSAGYAVFPSVGKGAIGVGGAYGRGELFEYGHVTGFCDLSQATIGFQLGGQAYSEVIFFENATSLTHFRTGNIAFAAQASAVAATSGASADANYENGVIVFTLASGGLMFEASIGGQKFTFVPQ